VINSHDASITIHLKKLLETLLGKDLNALPANFDLINFLLDYLSSPSGLAAGLAGVIDGITTPLSGQVHRVPHGAAELGSDRPDCGSAAPADERAERRQDAADEPDQPESSRRSATPAAPARWRRSPTCCAS